MSSFRRIPIKPAADPYEALAYCDEHDWPLLAREEDPNFLHEIFDPGQGQVHVMVDYAAEKCWFVLIGEHASALAAGIYDHAAQEDSGLEVCTDEEALAIATTLEHPGDIYYACLIATDQVDPRILECYQRAFASPDPDVRFCACTSAGYFIDWEEPIKPLLQRVMEHDSDQGVREVAERALASLARHDWNRGTRTFERLA